MSDLEIDRTDRDLVFREGRLTVVKSRDARAQRIFIALAHFKGEWFLDQNAGTDMFGRILGRVSDLSRRAEYRRRLLGVPGVVEVTSIALRLDPRTRNLTGTIECIDKDGETHTAQVVDPGAEPPVEV